MIQKSAETSMKEKFNVIINIQNEHYHSNQKQIHLVLTILIRRFVVEFDCITRLFFNYGPHAMFTICIWFPTLLQKHMVYVKGL